MPIKNMMRSYRNRNGVFYMSEGDVCDASLGDLKAQAAAQVKAIRVSGRKAFHEKFPDGSYYRVFAEVKFSALETETFHDKGFLEAFRKDLAGLPAGTEIVIEEPVTVIFPNRRKRTPTPGNGRRQ